MVDVSTYRSAPSPQSHIDRYHALRRFILGLRNMQDLLRPEHLARRLNVLDEIDAMIGDLDLGLHAPCSHLQIIAHANALKSEFEAANEKLFLTARSEFSFRGNSPAMRRWLCVSASDRDAERPHPGLGFDFLDEIVSGILQFRSPGNTGLLQTPEMVPYQPTPTRHILDLIAAANLSNDDLVVDLGSGLGHVPLLISILTGVHTFGIEIQPDFVASAQECARSLNLSRARFVAADARTADLSSGTAFYLFSPFTGSILTDVLKRLSKESNTRQIRICSLGPCVTILRDELWLRARTPPNSERITVFESR